MASTRKSRTINKRFSYPNEISPLKDRDSGSKSNKRKRKVSDMLGPQWSKEDIQRFYEAYRKYGKDWQKVAAAVRNRSVEMVEALYTMNRAYLSLPEGTASVVGLIAMMTDHYSVLEASDSEQESNDGNGLSRKPYKRARGKPQSSTTKGSDRHFLDVSHSPSVTSSFGCLSLLNKRNSGGIQPRAVGKRTPRIPVRYAYDKDNLERHISPSRQRVKHRFDAATDDDVNEVALALAEASHRGGSPQVSQTANKKSEAVAASPARLGERMCSESEMSSAKNIGINMDDDGCEGSLGSTEGDNNFPRQKPRFVGRKISTSLAQQKAKKSCGKELEVEDTGDHDIDDIKEACSGTEGQKFSRVEGTHGGEVADVTFVRSSGQTSKKRSKKVLFGRDEDDALDALQALADLSLMMPSTTVDTESIMPMKKGKESGFDKSGAREIVPRSQQRDKPKSSPFKKGGDQSVINTQVSDSRASKPGKASGLDLSTVVSVKDVGVRRRKPKSSVAKISEAQIDYDAHDLQKKEFPDQGRKHVPLARVSEHSSSSTDIKKEGYDSVVSSATPSATNKVKSPTKSRSRRKLDKSLIHRNYRDMKLSETSINDQSNMSGQLYCDKKTIGLKERLFNCLSNYRVRRWCIYEWFYSAIDYPWFAKSEFVEYLYHVGLGHVPRLTRVEWDVIRSSLGKPRRFSEQFLKEEKAKLNYYRQSVRNHYSELRLGKGEGLPTDLARPLTVGQRVIAIHPRSREVHNGSVLTVDHNRCRVQFDRPELGVEFVKDIDCMPLNPMENVPTSLNITVDKFEALKQFKVSERYEDATKELLKFPPSAKVEIAEGLSDVAAPHVMNNMQEQAKEAFISPSLHLKVGQFEASGPQQALISQQSMLSQMLSKDADIRALAELTRVLDKKNAVVTELRCMNDDISEDSSLKDVDSFKKQYAAVLVQLNEVLDQVSCALMRLRQRNTYQGNLKLPFPVQMARSDDRGNLNNNLSRLPIVSQETGSHVYEIVETSRVRAQKMVNSVLQALSSMNGGSSIQKIEDAIDYVNNQLSVDAMLPLKASQVNGSLGCQNQQTSCTSNLVVSDQALTSKTIGATFKREPQIPSELITNCVATLLMIQKCTERQFPPADVAQILDFAVTSLQPCSSHNLPVYTEIQKCMGIIRSQILALVPT